jgi:pentatricopeptide repeat protein
MEPQVNNNNSHYRPFCFRFDLSRLDEMEQEISGHLDSSNQSAQADMAQYYRTMIDDHCARDELEQALAVWKDMKPQQIVPDMHTHEALVAMCARHYRSKDALDIYNDIKARQIKPSYALLRTLLLMYCEMEHAPDALSILYDCKDWFYRIDAEIYLALIELLAKQRLAKDAKTIFNDWKSEGELLAGLGEAKREKNQLETESNFPNARAYHCLIEMYCGLGQDTNAEALLKEMEANRMKPFVETFIALLQMYANLGKLSESRACFSRALELANERSDRVVLVQVYHAFLRSFADRDDRERADAVWLEMREKERLENETSEKPVNTFVVPLASYHTMMSCYARLGDLAAVMSLFAELRFAQSSKNEEKETGKRRVRADTATYMLLIEWHVRMHRFSEALALHAELLATGMAVSEEDLVYNAVRQRIEQAVAKEGQAKVQSETRS